ncbi:hypothetical protein [Murimonas intestini]|uniref:ABC transporter permease n=1 Tax=Murimonas intestini TaxID=1337051 RepID=A0AB73T6Y8_9FIRM|nr:hypothetical protein [Murimonas intestini]MCR1839510.1 hypothetical protein [Murimonas intestini]MCR1866354.1 hypothetical protein [Murimonas intestini]MCR1882529.1 hypothetical protein [Murimonas intestini]
MRILELMGYEYKKMFNRRSFWLNIIAGFLLMGTSGFLMLTGKVYLEGEFAYTHMEYINAEKEAGSSINGIRLDEKTLTEAQKKWNERQKLVPGKDITKDNFLEIQREYLPYVFISRLGRWEEDEQNAQMFYEDRAERQMALWNSGKLSDEEIKYLKEQDSRIERPWKYAYNDAYGQFQSLNFTNIMILSILIVICLSPVFAEEYTTHVDALMLSAKNGRKRVITAKILTGLSFAAVLSLTGYLAMLAEQVIIYGKGDLSAPMQVILELEDYAYPFSTGKMLLITLACSVLASLLSAVIVMMCSARMKSSFGPAVTGILMAFLPVFSGIVPESFRGIHMFVQAFPGNFGTYKSIFSNQLMGIGNLLFPAYIYVPVFYAAAAAVMIALAARGYLRRQL